MLCKYLPGGFFSPVMGSYGWHPISVNRSATKFDFIILSKGETTDSDGVKLTSNKNGFKYSSSNISNPSNWKQFKWSLKFSDEWKI